MLELGVVAEFDGVEGSVSAAVHPAAGHNGAAEEGRAGLVVGPGRRDVATFDEPFFRGHVEVAMQEGDAVDIVKVVFYEKVTAVLVSSVSS